MTAIRRDVWQWLLDAGTVAPSRASEANEGKILIDQTTSACMESGIAMTRALEALDERHIKQVAKVREKPSKNQSTRDLKFANWKIIAKVLFKYSIKLTDSVLDLICDGDFELVLDIYYDLFARVSQRRLKMGPTTIDSMGRMPVSRRDEDAEQETDDELLQTPIDELAIDTKLLTRMEKFDQEPGSINDLKLEKCKTTFEMLLFSMMQCLELPGRVVAGYALLGPAHTKFESLVVNGMIDEEGQVSYLKITSWIGALHRCIDTLTSTLVRGLRERNRDAGLNYGARILGTLQPAMISHNLDVAALSVDLLKKLASALHLGGYGDVGYRWMILEGGITRGGLPYMVACAHQHHELRPEIGVSMDLLSRGRMLRLFEHHLPAIIPNKTAYLAFAQDLVTAVVPYKPARDAITKSGLVEFLLAKGLHSCQPGGHSDLRQTALLCLTEVWCAFPQAVFEGRQGQGEQIVDALKRGARDTSLSLQIASIANLFHLLETTVNDSINPRNPHAPRVYKTLIFLLIENHSNEIVREFLVTNLSTALEPIPDMQLNPDGSDNKMMSIPVGVLIDPLVKQASTHGYNNHDFELFGCLARHARLTVDQCLPLADLLGKIALNDPLFGRSASKPLEQLLRRHGHEVRMHEYVERFAKVSLSTFMHVETKYGGQMRAHRDANKAAASKDGGGSHELDFNVLMIRHALIVHMLELVCKIGNPIYNYRMLPLMERVNEQYSKLNDGTPSKGIYALIRMIKADDDTEDRAPEGGYEYAEDSDDDDDDNGFDAETGYTRRKRHQSSGNNRDMMDAARRGQILVFSDEEDENDEDDRNETDSNRKRRRKKNGSGRRFNLDGEDDGDNEDDYDDDARYSPKKQDSETTGDDEFVSTGSGGKRVFKRGAEFPSVKTDDLFGNKEDPSEKGSPQRRKPTQPSGAKNNRGAPSPRESRAKSKNNAKNKKDKNGSSKTMHVQNKQDRSRREHTRGVNVEAKKRLQKEQAQWMVGKRKIKMKIKKAPKTVQGDIDAYKNKHEMKLRNRERKQREKDYRESQVRRRMRIQFERKLAFKKMYRRRAVEDKKRGNHNIALFGRPDKGDRHAGDFYERQAAMLQVHLDAAGESQRKVAQAQAWIELSLKLFKRWLKPLEHIFTIYTSEFVNAFSPAFDFQALMERSGGLAIGEYMKLSRDFRLVPKIMNKTESLSLYHYANAEDGNRTARHNEPLLGFEELVSCLHGIAMGPHFKSLPLVQEKIDALMAFMRRQAISQGLHNKDLHRRLGNKRQWETGRCPMYEYRFMIPPKLPMKDSLRFSLEILDSMVSNAAHVHILDLVKVEWKPTLTYEEAAEQDIPEEEKRYYMIEQQEEEWEPPNTTPLQSDRLYPSVEIEKNKRDIHPSASSHKYGFGGGFLPKPKSKRIKRTQNRRFGEKCIGKLALRFVPAAKYMISLLAELADDCCDGSARVRLLMRYDIQGTGWDAITEAEIRDGKEDTPVLMGERSNIVPPKPEFTSPRQKEKNVVKDLREHHDWEVKEQEREHKRRQRVAELDVLLEAQRGVKQEKLKKKQKESLKKKEYEKRKEMKRRQHFKQQTVSQKREVEEWIAKGGKHGSGKRITKMKDYANYMSTKTLDPAEYAEQKRKKMLAMKKKKEEQKKAEEKAKELKQKKMDMAEESRRNAVESQKNKREAAVQKKKEDDLHAIEVAKEGMAGTEHLYDPQEEKAAVLLESVARGKRDRKRVAQMRADKKQKEKAAIKLEAVARGKRDRKKVKEMKRQKKEAAEAAEAVEAAAAKEKEGDEEVEEEEGGGEDE